jgi:hypothetical protein
MNASTKYLPAEPPVGWLRAASEPGRDQFQPGIWSSVITLGAP